jgi:hypothetical protein
LRNGPRVRFGTGTGLHRQLRVNFGLNASARFQYCFGLNRIFFATGRNQAYLFLC